IFRGFIAEEEILVGVKVGQKKELPPVDHSTIKYLPFRKNVYVQVREIALLKDHEVEAIRKTHGNIKIRGKNCPRPIKTFFQCGLPERIVKGSTSRLSCAISQLIQKREYVEPFPIQMQAIPALMSGRDVIGVAETGSGKTLAYVLPMLRHVLDQPALKDAVNLRCVVVYGGTGIGEQLGALRRGVEVVVGTPGRLIDVFTISNGKVTNL
ncbi:putative ethylene-responsive Rna helicase, partial [Cardiosporidium cionae]